MKNLSVQLKPYELIAGWIYFAFQMIGLGSVALIINMHFGNPLSKTELNALLFVFNFAAIVLIFHKYLLANLKCYFSRFGKNVALTALGLGIYVALNNTTAIMIGILDPAYTNANDANINQMMDESFWMIAGTAVLLVPLTEEVLYRGLLFGSLYRCNKILGLVLSMVIFSMIHVLPYLGSADPLHLIMSFFTYLPAGFALAWVYVSTDSIFAGTFIHMLINGIGIIATRFMYG